MAKKEDVNKLKTRLKHNRYLLHILKLLIEETSETEDVATGEKEIETISVTRMLELLKDADRSGIGQDASRKITMETLKTLSQALREPNPDINKDYMFPFTIEPYPQLSNGDYDYKENVRGYYLSKRPFNINDIQIIAEKLRESTLEPELCDEYINRLKMFESIKNREKIKPIGVKTTAQGKKESKENTLKRLKIYRAISEKKKIEFSYGRWKLDQLGDLRLGSYGGKRIASPYDIIENYGRFYMIAKLDTKDIVKRKPRTYRIDRMLDINILDEECELNCEYSKNEMETIKRFGMMSGTKYQATLEFHKNYLEIILDKFGSDVRFRKSKNGRDLLQTDVKIVDSAMFYGWIAGIGGKIAIVEPEICKLHYHDFLKMLLETEGKPVTYDRMEFDYNECMLAPKKFVNTGFSELMEEYIYLQDKTGEDIVEFNSATFAIDALLRTEKLKPEELEIENFEINGYPSLIYILLSIVESLHNNDEGIKLTELDQLIAFGEKHCKGEYGLALIKMYVYLKYYQEGEGEKIFDKVKTLMSEVDSLPYAIDSEGLKMKTRELAIDILKSMHKTKDVAKYKDEIEKMSREFYN